MGYLIVIRHGESRWNLANKFTGWVDVPLSKHGVVQTMEVARQLKKFPLDVCFTSCLERAQETLLLILAEQNLTGIFQHKGAKYKHRKLGQDELPVFMDVAFNERFYGDLQGMDKNEARKRYGESKVFQWRRSFRAHPPKGESLKGVYDRVVPYFTRKVVPFLKQGKNVIISAHGNSLRALVKHIEDISDEEIPHLSLPTGKTLFYQYAKGKYVHDHKHKFTRPVCWTKKCV